MPTTIGPHLLGRRELPPDPRDFRLGNFMGWAGRGSAYKTANEDPLDLVASAEQELKLTTVTFRKWAATQYADVRETHWWRAFDYLARARAAISGSSPVDGVVSWPDPEPVLDQGDTPHCVGFAGAQWGNTLPVDDRFVDDDGHALYYECKVLDGEPNEENGSDGRSLAKALVARGRIKVYAFAASVDELVRFVAEQGPLFVGTWWSNEMFEPDASGLIVPGSDYVGGHEYVLKGYDRPRDLIEYLNSWGDSWGDGGRFYIKRTDYEGLWNDQGDGCAAVELPL